MGLTFTPSRPEGVRTGVAEAAHRLGVTSFGQEPVYVFDSRAEAAMRRHANSSDNEVAGILAGRVWTDADSAIVLVEAAIRAEKHVETTSVHVSFRNEAWDEIARELDALGTSLVVVGWYHTHPNLGAFFSGTDRGTQASAFRQPWQIGIVMDPGRAEEGRLPWAQQSPRGRDADCGATAAASLNRP